MRAFAFAFRKKKRFLILKSAYELKDKKCSMCIYNG
jgi:hypothetical protein